MAGYTVTRSVEVAADPATCHALVEDLHAWQRWSPWEDDDVETERTFSGPARGVGARYAWRTSLRSGRGSAEILASTVERVDARLDFEAWKAGTVVAFLFVPTPSGTQVTWTMDGEHRRLAAVLARFVDTDKLFGRAFARGLARLKAAAEEGPHDTHPQRARI